MRAALPLILLPTRNPKSAFRNHFALFNPPPGAIMPTHFARRLFRSRSLRSRGPFRLLFKSSQRLRHMPTEIKKHQTVLDAIRNVDIISGLLDKHDGHFAHELDLEVIAYGRNYNGKKVGPYLRLYEYGAGEQVIREGDWGGNTFYITVDGRLDVFVRDPDDGRDKKVAE